MADPNTAKPIKTPDPHPGMMGDGTEEQNLDQTGDPSARISKEEVEAAFKNDKGSKPNKH